MFQFKKIFLLIITAGFLLTPVLVLAADKYGIEETKNQTSLKTVAVSSKYKGNLPALVGDIVTAGLTLIGIVFFLLILYGGIYWMTAMGRTEQAEKAKEILEKAIVGLVIVGASYAIANFVFSSLTASKGSNTVIDLNSNGGATAGCCLWAGGNKYQCNPAIDKRACNAKTDASYVTDCGQCQ